MGNGELKSQYSPIFPRVGIPRGQPLVSAVEMDDAEVPSASNEPDIDYPFPCDMCVQGFEDQESFFIH